MNNHATHNKEIVSQFTRQAIPFTTLPGHLNAVEMLIEMSEINKTSRVLDVASGPGLVAIAFAEIARQVTCLDMTPAMLEQARKQAAAKGLANLIFQEGDAYALPYSDDSFDAVITRYTFHHFLQPEAVLNEMIRVCQPGGRIVVADVAIKPSCSAAYNQLEKLRDSSHVRALSLPEFTALFSRSDLVDSAQARYSVDVNLEEQLAASFPKENDAAKVRAIIAKDIGTNKTGTQPRKECDGLYYTYPISIFSARKHPSIDGS